MKRENFIFIALILAAAVVLGTTFGIVQSFLVVRELKTEQKAPAKTQDKESSDTDQKQTDEADKKTEDKAAVTVEDTSSGTGTANTLTSAEVGEINRMLAQLGYGQKDIADSIKSFQTGNNMQVTGKIDETTLESIVRETTLRKARALAQ